MDDNFTNLQEIYRNTQLTVDSQDLLASIKKRRDKEKVKAWLDLVLGVCVSALIVYLLIAQSYSLLVTIVLILLVPIPIGFSIWAFRARSQKSSLETLDIAALIDIKQQQARTKVRYWKVSAIVMSILWAFLFFYLLYCVLRQQEYFTALVQVTTQLAILVLVWLRYLYLAGNLEDKTEGMKRVADLSNDN